MFVAVFSKRHPIFIRLQRHKKSAEEIFPLPIFERLINNFQP